MSGRLADMLGAVLTGSALAILTAATILPVWMGR